MHPLACNAYEWPHASKTLLRHAQSGRCPELTTEHPRKPSAVQAGARVSVPSTGKGKASMMMKVLSGVTWHVSSLSFKALTLKVSTSDESSAFEAVAVDRNRKVSTRNKEKASPKTLTWTDKLAEKKGDRYHGKDPGSKRLDIKRCP